MMTATDPGTISKIVKRIDLNILQMTAVLANKRYGIKNIFIEAGRGVGKSTILAWYIQEAMKQMPRATGVLVGETYIQIKSRTLPSTKEGLEMLGFYENVDYVVGRSGRDSGFEMPFQAPNSWANVIHFRNGFILTMVSLEDSNAGRGVNGYIVIGDEAALLRYERLYTNVLIVNRAKKIEFEKASLCNAQIFASTVAMTKTGEWFAEREKLAKSDPQNYFFVKGNAMINKHNLRDGYFEDMKKESLSKLHYDAEIMNIRPRGVTDGFYAQLDPTRHYYYHKFDTGMLLSTDLNSEHVASCKYDRDLVKGQPLQVNLDFGGNINCATIAQFLKSQNEYRVLKEFVAKKPKKLNDLVRMIIDYYGPHQESNKTIYLYHDRSGYKEEANSKTTLAQDVENLLRSAGWTVINMTPNTNNPSHILKFRLLNAILAEEDLTLPVMRINSDNCPNLVISMENAPIKLNKDGFEKDKSSERSLIIKQEHATHLSDTIDYGIYWQFSYLLSLDSAGSVFVSNI